MRNEWALGFFEAKGSFCITGTGKTFALEAFSRHRDSLDTLKAIWGGHVIAPPPSAPSRWTWRLYGQEAEQLWLEIRADLPKRLVARGDRKFDQCQR